MKETSGRMRRVGPGYTIGLALLLGIATGAILRAGPDVSRAGPGRAIAGADEAGGAPFVSVARAVLPGVVSVDVRRLFQHPSVDADSTGELLWPFGGDNEIEVPSSGSGFVFDPRGYILTNTHVIDRATEIRVHFIDGREMIAELIGADHATDVAVLRVESPEPLDAVALGDSDSLRIGEWVAAVGNPLGVLEGSVTVGVVSGKARNDISIGSSTPSYQDFIQTDAAINFGNSGGPLVNRRGEAVGVNTAFSGPGRGLGFAVSINLAREVARGLMNEGKVPRGYLGVVLQEVDRNLAEGLRLARPGGVLIRGVQDGTPAAEAGLRVGDVVLEFDRKAVADLPSFRMLVARTEAGRSVPVTIYRDGRTEERRVQLAERPAVEQTVQAAAPVAPSDELGLEFEAEPAEGEPAGARVRGVKAGTRASLAGVQPDDLVVEVNGTAVGSPEACEARIHEAEPSGRPAVLRVVRRGETWFVALPARR